MATKKVESFSGREDVKKFITKCDLHCEIKAYDEEKKAAFIAGRLEEPAFDVYMALPEDDKKDPEKMLSDFKMYIKEFKNMLVITHNINADNHQKKLCL